MTDGASDLACLRIVDAVSHEDALDEIGESPEDAQLRADVAAIDAVVQERLAALRRAALAPAGSVSAAGRPSVARTRAEIVARLQALLAGTPRFVLAYRDFDGMSDQDLATALEDAEVAAGRTE